MKLKSFVASMEAQALTFINPIIGGYSAQKCLLKVGDFYYLTLSNLNNTELTIYKSLIVTNFQNVEKQVIFSVSEGVIGLAPSEMLEINGDLYLHFVMASQVGERLYVMKANNPMDPMMGWGEPIRLLDDWEHNVQYASVMKHNNKLYFVWTTLSTTYSLFIAPMANPTSVVNPKVLLREPNEDWECHGLCVSEAASFIYNKNVTYLIYSASSWMYPDHCLSQMSIAEGDDPLVPENWHASNEPVFWRNDEEDVYAPGAAKFTVSPDGRETWMIYHAATNPANIYLKQTARLEKIEWNEE